jgi:hypothetical protein
MKHFYRRMYAAEPLLVRASEPRVTVLLPAAKYFHLFST